ncbi:MAG: NAD-binding protein [Halanaeroarchaeum sp.]
MAQLTDRLGARSAVLLTTAVGVLSMLTGMAAIGTREYVALLPVPAAVSALAGFTGALTGFVVLIAALGLRRHLAIAWYATVVLIPFAALQGLVQSSVLSLPLVGLGGVAMATVVRNRRHFDRGLSLSPTQTAATVAVLGSLGYGSVGAYALREQFVGVETATDAVYYALVTASTVGYGDVTPRTSLARWFGMTVVVLGAASFAAALGALLGPAIERRLAHTLGRMSEQRFDLLEGHLVVLGTGDLTEPILEELTEERLVVVTDDVDRAAALRDRGHDVLTGDPSDEDVLGRVGVESARAVLAATNSDADDAFAIMTARERDDEVPIVAAATDRDNVRKLKRAGATTVISPQVLGAHLLVQSALGTAGIEAVADEIMDAEGSIDADAGDEP